MYKPLLYMMFPLLVTTSSAMSGPDHPGLHNVNPFSESLINGSAPENDEAFDSLRKMGIKTIISVDGANPDVTRASAGGMRYVHLPIGYDGIDETEGLKLIRAVRDLPKPIYVHCYHGVHRSPAAAAYALVGLGQVTPEQALSLMHRAGTSEKYTGLYEVVRQARPADMARIDAIKPDFPAKAEVTGMVQTRAAIGRSWDRMKLLNEAGWRTPPDHPDIDPANESKILAEHFTALSSNTTMMAKAIEFYRLLGESREATRQLHEILSSDRRNSAARTCFEAIENTCTSCHVQFRN